MIIAHYGHRLPAEYDLSNIRDRARARGQLWDTVPELFFKAFLLRERGRFGATTNEYSSLYLWRKDEGFRNFLVDGRYKFVIVARGGGMKVLYVRWRPPQGGGIRKSGGVAFAANFAQKRVRWRGAATARGRVLVEWI